MFKTTMTALAVTLALILAPVAAEAKGKSKKAHAEKSVKTKNWPSKPPKGAK